MKFITGQNRYQMSLLPRSLEETIDPDNEVRLIDLFVDSLSLAPKVAKPGPKISMAKPILNLSSLGSHL